MSPKKLSTIKSGTIRLGHWYRVLQLPLEIQPAVFALIDHGIDGEKLLKLVAPPKRGRPSGKLKRDKRPPGRPLVYTLQYYTTMLAQAGNSLHLIGRVLNHSTQATTAVYARFAQDPVREALEAHSKRVLGVAGKITPAMVEAIKPKSKRARRV